MSKTVRVRFSKINKSCTLRENDERLREFPSKPNLCVVEKSISVAAKMYRELGQTLLSDNAIWENIGGVSILDDDSASVAFSVVEVINADDSDAFYVNTEGHNYARYVGRQA